MRRLMIIVVPSLMLGGIGCSMHAHGDDAASLAQEPVEERREKVADAKQFWGGPPPLSRLNNEVWPPDLNAPPIQTVGATMPATPPATPGGMR